ncbi:hypothetical protein [Solitalea lacus]|uniref:hypothetical protein n=1 Tax=Solitalea lacus TaxID=2911172 RepID=UPI001EDBAD5F|nr:hypothetical protein [Solitalea lacus]UKJ06747.1 hypothetical protein L2B55_14560 [Solitalea lacus]
MLYWNTVNDLLKESLLHFCELDLHKLRFEWTHYEAEIFKNFKDFSSADVDFDPICLRIKEWEFIKENFEEAISDKSVNTSDV